MKPRGGSFQHYTSPVRAWLQKVPVAALLALAVLVMVLGKADTVLIERVRAAINDAVTPALAVLAEPIAAVTRAVDNVARYTNLPGELARLEEERNRLRHWEAAARRLEGENRELRRLLNLAVDPNLRYISARVVADTGGAFVRSLLVAAGGRDGVAKGQAAVTGEGLIGRVIEVGQRSARILLITDINSRVPILVERSRERAVVAGDNSSRLRLTYLARDADVTPGDRIVTSGHGGVFVPGLPVGVVSAIQDGIVYIQPFADWDRIEYVRMIDYELPRALLGPIGEDRPLEVP